jgi:hypothetical protein
LKGAVTKWRNEVIGNSLKSLNFLSLEGKALKRPGIWKALISEAESFDLGGMIVSQVDAV